MKSIAFKSFFILTIITIAIWFGYEFYSSVTEAQRKAEIKRELLRELQTGENSEVIEDLSRRLAY